MKNINDIFYWLISTGTLGVVVKFAWSYIKPVLEEKKAHAKAEKARTEWGFLEQVADAAVHSMDSKPKTGSEKFASAVETVTNALQNQNMKVSENSVKTAVQSAYEKADLPHSKPVIESSAIEKVTAQGITTGTAPEKVNLKDIPGATKKTDTKPYSVETAKSVKGIPTDNLEDIAVQTPDDKGGADNAN